MVLSLLLNEENKGKEDEVEQLKSGEKESKVNSDAEDPVEEVVTSEVESVDQHESLEQESVGQESDEDVESFENFQPWGHKFQG